MCDIYRLAHRYNYTNIAHSHRLDTFYVLNDILDDRLIEQKLEKENRIK